MQPTDGLMDSVMGKLAEVRWVTGPATAAEKALVNTYIQDSDDDADTTTNEIDAFEKRLAARPAARPPNRAAAPIGTGKETRKEPPAHLLHLLDISAGKAIEHDANGLDFFSPEPVSRKFDGFSEAGKTTMKWPDDSTRSKSNSMNSDEDLKNNSRIIYEEI